MPRHRCLWFRFQGCCCSTSSGMSSSTWRGSSFFFPEITLGGGCSPGGTTLLMDTAAGAKGCVSAAAQEASSPPNSAEGSSASPAACCCSSAAPVLSLFPFRGSRFFSSGKTTSGGACSRVLAMETVAAATGEPETGACKIESPSPGVEASSISQSACCSPSDGARSELVRFLGQRHSLLRWNDF